MEELLLFLNQPEVLWSLFAGAVGLVLIDYVFPVDWPAYFGYALFGIFVGATSPLSEISSFIAMAVVFALMLLLHKVVFSRYLTNAPKHELARGRTNAAEVNDADDNDDSMSSPQSSNPEGANYVAR